MATGSFSFEEKNVAFLPGQSVGAALVAASVPWLRSAEDGSPRGLTCAIGVCWECRCVIDGRANTRACMTMARQGMVVRRQEGLE
jgi:hypothetical protein